MLPGRLSSKAVRSGSLLWLRICLHDTTRKCRTGANHTGASSPRLLYRVENSIPARNLATVSCIRRTTTRFGMKSASVDWNR